MTFGEILKTAGIDTLLGMGTVFLLLIFMSVLISCFRFIPWLRPHRHLGNRRRQYLRRRKLLQPPLRVPLR